MALLALGALLSGCAPGFRRDLGDRLPTLWSRVQPGDVPVLLPTDGGARPIAARRRTIGEVFDSYNLILSNPTSLPGENRLSLDVEWVPDSIFGAMTRPDRPYPVPLYTEERLLKTLSREFPDMDPAVGDTVRRNRYGDYDFAIARNETSACVLAWQLIDDRERILPETLAAIRLEWRVCGSGRSVEALLRPFEGLILTVAPDLLEAEPVARPSLAIPYEPATPRRPPPAATARPLPRETMDEFEGNSAPPPATTARPLPRETMNEFEGTSAGTGSGNSPRVVPPLVLGTPP